MREIKFRAWDNEDKKMYKVVRIEKSIYGYCECDNLLVCNLEANERLKETDVRVSYDYKLMEFTGLCDKNGKEIYEGDIVEVVYPHKSYITDRIGVVEYGTLGRFQIKGEKIHCAFNHIINFEWKIIGNIFENPELVKGVE